jgi:hypothetical protein
MKVTLKGKIDNHLVEFESNLGYGIAIWGNNKPLLNTSYTIELEIDDFFEWGKNITLETKHESSIKFINKNMIFNGKVISCEHEGILVLALGEDIVFIETSDKCEINSYVSFFTVPNNVILYPIEL